MRRQFADFIYKTISNNKNVIIVTGDLGYKMWDRIRSDFPDNFINVGSAEQLMIGVCVGLAREEKIPIAYSITPFLLYRPFELIRNYIHNENINVKLVGAGRGMDYAHDGFSHWDFTDINILSNFPNIGIYKPQINNIDNTFTRFINDKNPGYLSLSR